MSGYTLPGVRAALKRIAAGEPPDAEEHRHSGQTLEGVAPVLGLYYRALAGRNAALIAYGNRNDPLQYPDTHSTIRLPDRVGRFATGNGNFLWYKIALTHRAAHYEGGTFAFEFLRPAAHFGRLRPAGMDELDRHERESDLETFFGLFAQRQLAVEVFTVMEDLRLDEWSKRRYPGLASGYDKIQRAAAHDRPKLAGMGPRNALAELMVRWSLASGKPVELPALLHERARQMYQVMQALHRPDARVEDSAEAAMRAYCLLVGLPNMEADYGPSLPLDLAQPAAGPIWNTVWPEPEKTRLEGDEVLATAMAPVPYRDQLGSRYTLYKAAGPLDQQAIYRFTEDDTPASPSAPTLPNGEERPKPPDEPLEHDCHDHFGEDEVHLHTGELHSHELLSFVYPEWDHVAKAYKRNWCCIKESRIDPASSPRYYDETLRGYGRLMPHIQHQFEQIAREGLRKVRRMPDGDDLDLDAAIESMIDMRCGLTPSEDVYSARQKTERDVAVAFLIDKSSSTAEQVEQKPEGLTPAAPHLHGRNYRTILDLEKETAALLMASLERIGDTYGIYFFSGSGREDVKFHVLKDFEERLSDRVAARIDNIKPLHTTRMGPAIRHTVRKLRGQESRTKLMVLISDGRPFDLDYGQQYGENAEVEYAINDTRQALNEARQAGITPFVLTIDPQGGDYLRAMCDGIDYEVLDDINQLPGRLLSLYRTLTA